MKYFILSIGLLFMSACSSDSAGNSDSANNTINGSYAKMITVNNNIYAIHDETLTTLDITIPDDPMVINTQDVGFTIENIFHHMGVLFIGAEEGLTIYSINENGIPELKSQTSYFESADMTSCDPVIVKDQYAYVTLSTDVAGRCGRITQVNELRIYNIQELENPILLSTTPMNQPKGLSIDGSYLFVCEQGETGLSVLNIEDSANPVIMQSFTGFESYDAITQNGLLMLVCEDEIRQYDYSDINNIFFLSGIEL